MVRASLVILAIFVSFSAGAREYFFALDKAFDRKFENSPVVVSGALTEIAAGNAVGVLKVEKLLKGSGLPEPLRVQLAPPAAGETAWKTGENGIWFLSRDTYRVSSWFPAKGSPALGLPARVAGFADRRWGSEVEGLVAAAFAYAEHGSPYVYYALTLKNAADKPVRLDLGGATTLEVVWIGKRGEKTVLKRKAAQLAHGGGRVKELQPGDVAHLHLGFTRSRRAEDLREVASYRLVYRSPSGTVESPDEKLAP